MTPEIVKVERTQYFDYRPFTPSFMLVNQLEAIKSAFKTAHENASNLHAEMESEIAKKESQIAALQEDIKTIGVTKQEAETFMSNIEKLI